MSRGRTRAGLLAAVLCAGVVTALLPAAAAASHVATVPTSIGVDVSLLTSQRQADDELVSDLFSTHAGNELLVAMFSADGPYDPSLPPWQWPRQVVGPVTGCGLTWTQASEQANEEPGVAAVFTAWATSRVTNCTVSGGLSYSYDGLVAVYSFTGAAAQPADVRPYFSHYDNAGYGGVDVPVDGGLVYQIGHNWSNAEVPVRVVANGTQAYDDPVPASLVGTYLSPQGDTAWVSKIDDPLPAMARGTDTYANLATYFTEVGYTDTVTISIQPA
jgi:hypothetical protein